MLMDDFGNGYSSLNMLKDVTVDILKLDMEFLAMNEKSAGKGVGILEHGEAHGTSDDRRRRRE